MATTEICALSQMHSAALLQGVPGFFSSLETHKIYKRRFRNDPFDAYVPESGKRNCSSQICRWSLGAKSEYPSSEMWATYSNVGRIRSVSTPSGRRAGTEHTNCFQITYRWASNSIPW